MVCLQVGVDINLAASSQWQAATLPFVAGLGPRKARALLQVTCLMSTGTRKQIKQYVSHPLHGDKL